MNSLDEDIDIKTGLPIKVVNIQHRLKSLRNLREIQLKEIRGQEILLNQMIREWFRANPNL